MTDASVPRGAKLISILLSLVAPVRMAWIVFNVGENNLSNDYLFRVPLVALLLDGKCSFGTFMHEAWNAGGHSLLALVPVYWVNARFFAWDMRLELALGLIVAGATVALVAATLSPRARWTLLPLLSLLLFSTTKVSSLTFGESSLQMGLAQLGVALVAFGFAKHDRPVVIAAFAAGGGILASWSWGGGTVVWPVLFAAFAARRERSRAAWSLLSAGAALGLFQYAWLFRLDSNGPSAPLSLWTKARLVCDLFGRPLANGIGLPEPSLRSQLTGAAGIGAAVLILVLLRARRVPVAPALLVGWTALVAAEIAASRTAVAPWYASPMALFWVGLVVLLEATPAPIRTGGILAVALLALAVQPTWEDKSFYLPSRAPASAACLREWRTAPPGCHARLFQWGDAGRLEEVAALGEALEQRGLSVFGPNRTYLLQGDTVLGRVGVEPPQPLHFVSAGDGSPRDASDFHRLALVLDPGDAVTWRVDLPPNVTRASFVARLRVATEDAAPTRVVRVGVAGAEREAHAFASAGGRADLFLDLRPYAGTSVTLRIGADGSAGGAPILLEAPRVLLALAGTNALR